MSKKALNVQDDSRSKGIQGNTSKSEIKCVCLNARSIINKKTELNIMVEDIKPHIIGITESWANKDITNAELGLEGYVMFRKDRIGRRGGGVLLYIKDTIPAYEVQLQEEADCNEAIWCNLVTGHTAVIIGVVYRCPNITKQNNEKIHNAINEVSKGDCIIMGDFNHGNIKWDTLQSTGVEDSTFLCLVQDNVLTQHVFHGRATSGPRARSGPRRPSVRPASLFGNIIAIRPAKPQLKKSGFMGEFTRRACLLVCCGEGRQLHPLSQLESPPVPRTG